MKGNLMAESEEKIELNNDTNTIGNVGSFIGSN
jgi:hypothetical protein